MALEKGESLSKQTSRTVGLLDLVIEQLDILSKAYKNNDKALAEKIVKNDLNINIEFQYIMDKSTWILSQHVFLGEELRMILGYNSISKEFERLGDVVAKIANHLIKSAPRTRQRNDILELLKMVRGLLTTLRGQVVNPDNKAIVKLAKEVSKKFDFYETRKKEYIKEMAKLVDVKEIEKTVNELHLAKRIQNMAAFIENTCEYLIYIMTGQNIDL